MEGVRSDDPTLGRLRDELMRHRDFFRAEIKAQGADPDSDDVTFVDDSGFADRGHSSEERSQVIAVVRTLHSNLRDGERALSKMDACTWRTCGRCGQSISVERPEALPWAVLCIDRKQRAAAR
jgi:RNA polymerase-binding transcription factor DksA